MKREREREGGGGGGGGVRARAGTEITGGIMDYADIQETER